MTYKLFRLKSPFHDFHWSQAYQATVPKELKLPPFPHTLAELRVNELHHHSYTKVLMFHTKQHTTGGLGGKRSYFLYDIVVFDESGQVYDFQQGMSEATIEKVGKRLASLLNVPFERQVTVG